MSPAPRAGESIFRSFRGGLSQLTDALRRALLANQVTIHTDCPVLRIESSGVEQARYWVHAADQPPIPADELIITVPTTNWHNLLPKLATIHPLATMEHVSVANTIFIYKKERLNQPLHGSGFVVPRSAGKLVTACTWTSSKWSHVAPADQVVIRCYVGRRGQSQWQQLSEPELLAKVRLELQEMTGINAEPLHMMFNEWHHSMPQYDVGHLQRLHEGERRLRAELPGVHVIGASMTGVGLPDCVRQARERVAQIVACLQP